MSFDFFSSYKPVWDFSDGPGLRTCLLMQGTQVRSLVWDALGQLSPWAVTTEEPVLCNKRSHGKAAHDTKTQHSQKKKKTIWISVHPPFLPPVTVDKATLLTNASHFLSPSVQFSRSVVSDSLRPHGSQNTRPPCPSPTPGVHSDSRPSSQ